MRSLEKAQGAPGPGLPPPAALAAPRPASGSLTLHHGSRGNLGRPRHSGAALILCSRISCSLDGCRNALLCYRPRVLFLHVPNEVL